MAFPFFTGMPAEWRAGAREVLRETHRRHGRDLEMEAAASDALQKIAVAKESVYGNLDTPEGQQAQAEAIEAAERIIGPAEVDEGRAEAEATAREALEEDGDTDAEIVEHVFFYEFLEEAVLYHLEQSRIRPDVAYSFRGAL